MIVNILKKTCLHKTCSGADGSGPLRSMTQYNMRLGRLVQYGTRRARQELVDVVTESVDD